MKHARPLLLAASALALFISACSQPADVRAPSLEAQFGTRGFDSVEDVAYGKAGYLYAVGAWNGAEEYDDDTGCDLDNQDAYLRRYDRSGNMVWEDLLDIEPAYESNQHIMTPTAVATDSSGNAVVAWSVWYYDYTNVGNNYGCGASDYQYFGMFNYLSKYSPSGKKLWRISISGNQVFDLATDGSGNIYTAANSALTKYTPGGARSWAKTMTAEPVGVAVSSTNNIYVVRDEGAVLKFNSSGTQLFAKTASLDGPFASNYKIAAGLGDELYITAQYQTFYDDACEGTVNRTGYIMRVYKLSASGTRQWYKDAAFGTQTQGYCDYDGSYNGDITDTPGRLNVASDNAGNVYLAGFRNSTSGDVDAFAAKYTRSGALAWAKGFGTAKDDGATSIATYDGTEVFVGGITKGYLVHRQLGQGDAFMREMNSSGNRVWTR